MILLIIRYCNIFFCLSWFRWYVRSCRVWWRGIAVILWPFHQFRHLVARLNYRLTRLVSGVLMVSQMLSTTIKLFTVNSKLYDLHYLFFNITSSWSFDILLLLYDLKCVIINSKLLFFEVRHLVIHKERKYIMV